MFGYSLAFAAEWDNPSVALYNVLLQVYVKAETVSAFADDIASLLSIGDKLSRSNELCFPIHNPHKTSFRVYKGVSSGCGTEMDITRRIKACGSLH